MTSDQSSEVRDEFYWRNRAHADQIKANRQKPGCPEAFGFRVYSQSDEDGIIAEIFSRIGATNKTFVEFGAEVGLENNCRYLLEQGWNGLWIEGHPPYWEALRNNHKAAIEEGRLKFVASNVDRDNINRLISESGISGEIDLLSIDIDGNDYHVWDAINVISPRVIVAEHNYYPPPRDYVMPYDPVYRWNGSSHDFGASFVANVALARRKGYTVVAHSIYSCNGFYVRDDLLNGKFPGPYDAASNYRQGDYEALINFPRPPSAAAAGILDRNVEFTQVAKSIEKSKYRKLLNLTADFGEILKKIYGKVTNP